MIEPDTVEYLESVVERFRLHQKTKEATIKYLQQNNISDKRVIENCIIISQVWAADCFGKGITNSEILVYLGESDIDVHPDDNLPMFLKDDLKGKNLNQVLSTVSKLTGSVFK